MLSRMVGVVFVIAVLALVVNPELVSDKPVPTDTFEAIERRIWWGLIPGFGILLLLHRWLGSWRETLAATLTALLVGLLVARLVGIALDGSVISQWVNVAIELVILVPLVWWYRRERRLRQAAAHS